VIYRCVTVQSGKNLHSVYATFCRIWNEDVRQLAPILERLQVSTTCWVDLIAGFGRWFRRAVGRPPNMTAECQRRGRRWLQGIAHAQQAFA
jgi:hypothetical protein